MGSKRPTGLARKTMRAATGGIVVVLALLVVMFFQGGGLGPGGNSTPESTDDLEVSADPGDAMLSSRGDSPEPAAAGELSEVEQRAISGDTLIVLVDEHDYYVQVSSDPVPQYEPADLQRIVVLAGRVRGDSNGIQVRIEKRLTARASAEYQLKLELERAGISGDAIFESAELIP